MSKNFIAKNPRLVSSHWNESNDCTVRASSIALGIDYDDVHKAYATVGRKPRNGATIYMMDRALREITGKEQGMVRVISEPTFAAFARENPKGRFIVVKRKHAVALIDGVWHDAHVSQVGSRNRVLFYYQVKE